MDRSVMYNSAVADVERVIAAHLAEWDSAHVELAIYGIADAAAIACAIDEFCRERLAVGVARALFYQSSIGAVAGLELGDGRRVVIKAHQPDWSWTRLGEIVRLQTHLAARGLFAPTVLAGPSPLGRGFAVAEEYVDRGVAYTARCVHALGRDERREPGTFQCLPATYGSRLLSL